MGNYRQKGQQIETRKSAQDLAYQVAVSRAKHRNGQMNLEERKLVLDNAIQQMNELNAEATRGRDAVTGQKTKAELDKLTREAAGINAMSKWQKDNPGQWPSAAIQAQAGFKPVQEKLDDNAKPLTDAQMGSYITDRFKDKGLLAAIASGGEADKTINATMQMAKQIQIKKGVSSTQAAGMAVDQMFRHKEIYVQAMAGTDYTDVEKAQITQDFYAKYHFTPKD